MIQIKPIIHMDDHGELKVIGKERGRKKALTHIVDMAVKQSEGWDNDIVMITHGDCKEDAFTWHPQWTSTTEMLS